MDDLVFDAYSWPPREPAADRRDLMEPDDIREGQCYIPHPDLIDAVNTARVLGRPLLVTGRPGTGKTRLACSIAWQLGLAGPFKYVAKSTSAARDLFYTYDALGRFHEAQITLAADEPRRVRQPLEFIEFAALGRAILKAHARSDVSAFLADGSPMASFHPGPAQRSVVVIDEIDKAPRDFPNDLLDELDHLRFRIHEVHPDRTTPVIPISMRPLIVITTNEERQLPDAFLRRCVFFPIPFPSRRVPGGTPRYTIEDIVERHIGRGLADGADQPLLASAVDLFDYLRQSKELQRAPGTAELLDWVAVLARVGAAPGKDIGQQQDIFLRSRGALLKSEADRSRAPEIFGQWLRARSGGR